MNRAEIWREIHERPPYEGGLLTVKIGVDLPYKGYKHEEGVDVFTVKPSFLFADESPIIFRTLDEAIDYAYNTKTFIVKVIPLGEKWSDR